MQYLNQFRGLPRQVYLICICRIIMGIGSMSYAFASIHLRSIIGLNEVQVAWVMLVIAVTNICCGLLGGKLADVYGRKKVAVTAYMVQVIVHAASIFLCRTYAMIPLMIISNGLGFIGYPVFSAMISDVTDPRRQRECFSLMYLCNNIGVAIGPAIGGMLFYSHLEWTFVIQAALVAAGISFFALTARDNYSRADALLAAAAEGHTMEIRTGAGDGMENGKEKTLLQIIFEHKMLLTFILSFATVSMCYQMTNYMLSMHTTDLFGLEISSRFTGFVWTTNGVVIVLTTPFLLVATKNNHHFVNMAIGVCLYALGYDSYSFMRTPYMVIGGAVLWTLGEILISTGSGAFIADNSPASHVARCQSLYETARSAGKAVGPVIFGYLLNYMNYNTAWRLNSCLCLLVAVWVYLAWQKAGKPSPSQH